MNLLNLNLEIPTQKFIYKEFNSIELYNKNGFLKSVILNKENLNRYKDLTNKY